MSTYQKGSKIAAGVFAAFVASLPTGTGATASPGTTASTREAANAVSPAAEEAIRAKASNARMQLAKKKFARVRTGPEGPWTQWKGQSKSPRK